MTALPQDESPPFDPALADTWQLVPVCWATLDRATAARQWAALADWVRWLATRYALATRTIPPCWYRHGGIVEELSALRTGWLAAFAPDARLSAALDWHQMFDGTRSRLHETTRGNGCTNNDHRDDDTARWLTIPDPGFAAACDTDLANRAHKPATSLPASGGGRRPRRTRSLLSGGSGGLINILTQRLARSASDSWIGESALTAAG